MALVLLPFAAAAEEPAATPSAAGEPLRIAALGDSLTQGYGLPAEEGFVPQLQAWLDHRGANVELINAGVSGDTTRGGLSRLDWTLGDGAGALMVALGGNDLLRGIDPAASRENLDEILRRSTQRDIPVLLIGMKASGNFGRDYKAAFDGIYPALAEKYGVLYEPEFLGALTARSDGPAALGQYLQEDNLHPNAEGVALIVEAIGPRVLDLARAARAGS